MDDENQKQVDSNTEEALDSVDERVEAQDGEATPTIRKNETAATEWDGGGEKGQQGESELGLANESEGRAEETDLAGKDQSAANGGPETEAAPSLTSELLETKLDAVVTKLLEAFDDKIRYDASKQGQIDRLHDELQGHRADLAMKAARPLVRGLIKLHRDIRKQVVSLRSKPEEELGKERLLEELYGVTEDIELLLDQNGVVAFNEPKAEKFNPHRQRVLRKVPTTAETSHGLVKEALRPGFEVGSELLEKEPVVVYEYDASLAVESEGAGSDQTV